MIMMSSSNPFQNELRDPEQEGNREIKMYSKEDLDGGNKRKEKARGPNYDYSFS